MPEDSPTKTVGSDVDVGQPEQDRFNELDLRVYAQILRKHRWLVALFTLLMTVAAAYVVTGMTPVYRASSQLLIEEKTTNTVAIQDLFEGNVKDAGYYFTQYEVLRSRKLARRVMEKLNLFEHPEFARTEDKQAAAQKELSPTRPTGVLTETAELTGVEGQLRDEPVERQIAVNRFLNRLSVTPIKKTKLVRIGFESTDPVLSAKVANTVAEVYIINHMDTRMEMSETASGWLAGKLANIKLRLAESQNNLLNYKEKHGLIDVGGSVGGLNEQQVGIVTTKLLEAQRATAESKILFDEVQSIGSNQPEALLSLPVVNSDRLVGQFKIARQEIQFKLDELSNRYGKKHPKVVDATSRLRTASANLHQQIMNIVDSIAKDYKLNQQSVNSLQQKLASETGKIQKVDRTRMELITLEQEVEANRKLYDTFYSRIREVDEAEDMSTSNAQISEFAEVPIAPIKPRKSLIVLVTALLSLLAAVAAAILFESMNTTIDSTDDVEKLLKLRMLGIIPLVGDKKRFGKNPPVLVPGSEDSSGSQFAESIRTIRTSITIDDLQDKQQVIMVTSALPGEGKSTLANHLAHSFSQLERVLLIECDMRRPSSHGVFEFERSTGLSDMLNGNISFAECIQLSVVDDLDVIPAGTIPDKPLELLTSKKFDHLLTQMRKRYDRIIIDSAPVQAVSDALMLGQYADSVIYAVRSASTPQVVGERGVKRLQQAGIKVSGAVVTCVDINKLEGYGGELQYQGYYDYYGYSEDVRMEVIADKPERKKDEPLEFV